MAVKVSVKHRSEKSEKRRFKLCDGIVWIVQIVFKKVVSFVISSKRLTLASSKSQPIR